MGKKAVEQDDELNFDKDTPGDEIVGEAQLEEGVALRSEKKKAEQKIEIEVIDDTPAEDRRVLDSRKRNDGKAKAEDEGELPPLPETEDALAKEIADYGKRSQQRIQQLYSKFHDERRAREAATRQQEEAIRYAQQLYANNQKMQEYLNRGETYLVEQVKKKAELALDSAKRDYKAAYESGDADAITKAVEAMNLAQIEKREAEAFKPLQAEKSGVQSDQQQQRPASVQQGGQHRVTPDPRAVGWAEKNKWFGTDRTMTAFAYGLHEDLVMSGVDPRSDAYYDKLDSEMKKRFPDKLQPAASAESEKARSSAPSVVAGVTRTPSSKKVTLTQTQVAIAKRLGVPLDMYAQQVLKEKEQGNA